MNTKGKNRFQTCIINFSFNSINIKLLNVRTRALTLCRGHKSFEPFKGKIKLNSINNKACLSIHEVVTTIVNVSIHIVLR